MFSNFSFVFLATVFFACSSDKGVTVFNSNPEAEITSHENGDDVLEGYATTFVGNVSDVNHSPQQLTVVWKTDTQELCEAGPPQTDGSTSCTAALSPQDTKIILEVKDEDFAPGTASVLLDVVPSQPPSCRISTPTKMGCIIPTS